MIVLTNFLLLFAHPSWVSITVTGAESRTLTTSFLRIPKTTERTRCGWFSLLPLSRQRPSEMVMYVCQSDSTESSTTGHFDSLEWIGGSHQTLSDVPLFKFSDSVNILKSGDTKSSWIHPTHDPYVCSEYMLEPTLSRHFFKNETLTVRFPITGQIPELSGRF